MRIGTLVDDIYTLVNGDLTEYISDNADGFAEEMGIIYETRLLNPREPVSHKGSHNGSLRMSSIGNPCVRKLWYREHHPSEAQQLHPSTRLKFLFGDFLEVLLLQLARDSGHRVEGEQDELEILGIKGHRDAVIDGVTIDCKSASSFSFKKFKEGIKADSDPFGYLGQLASYVKAGEKDPLVVDKKRGGFLVIDKQHGHIHLDLHNFDNLDGIEDFYKDTIQAVDDPSFTPYRAFKDEIDGKSGNKKLGVNCSYCDFKHLCWPDLRTFIYSNGPKYLTKVIRVPDVFEPK